MLKRQDSQPKKTLRLWGRLSLGRKFGILMWMLVAQNILLIIGIGGIGALFIQNYHVVMQNSYQVNTLLNDFASLHAAFSDAVLYREEDAQQVYLNLLSQVEAQMEQISFAPDRQEERTLLGAVSASYESYRQSCSLAYAQLEGGGDFLPHWEQADMKSQYILGYIQNLLRQVIEQGNLDYQRGMAFMGLVPYLLAALLLGALLNIMISTRYIRKQLVRPILKLTEVARQMTENRFEIPDLIPAYNDEMSTLMMALNQLKHATAQLLTSMEKESQLTRHLHEEEVRHIQTEASMNNLRLSLLQSQINPHFLFNTLNTIGRVAQLEHAEQTNGLILHLANLFRYKLQSLDNRVLLEKELKIIDDYWQIQQVRYGKRIQLQVDCQVDATQISLPVFILQPLIENAVIHGISPQTQGGRVTLEIRREGGMLSILIRDSGAGMSPDTLQSLLEGEAAGHVTRLGVSNVRNRILLSYPGSRFEIESQEGIGTTVLIHIPYRNVAGEGGEAHVSPADRRG